MKKLALALAVASLSTVASADTIIGAVSGLVQARNSQTLMNVRAGMRIPDGYELQVPARGSATISMPGCSATIGPGTTPLTLDSCMQIAQAGGATPPPPAAPVPPAPVVGGGLLGGATTTMVVVGGTLGLATIAVVNRNNNNNDPAGPSNQ
jgi:hypothetical protein